MTIIGIFKNNTAVFMSQLSKFPQDPSPAKKRIDNATGVNNTAAFYNETTGDTDIDMTLAGGIITGGILKTGSGTDNVQFVTFSLKRTANPTGSVVARLFNENDLIIAQSSLIAASTLQVSYTDIEFDLGSVKELETDYRLTVNYVLASLSDVNFVSLETDAATTTAGYSQTTRIIDASFVDDATNSTVMTADSQA